MNVSRTPKILSGRFGAVFLLIFVVAAISFLTRLALLVRSIGNVDLGALNLPGIFGLGLFYDLINGIYVAIPVTLYLWLLPDRIFQKLWHRFVLYGIFFVFTFGLLFNAVAEWFFWDEFNTRFNFIAVDYLVYTNEVIGNIVQSYPIAIIITALFVCAVAIVFALRPLIKLSSGAVSRFKTRTVWALCYFLIPVCAYFSITSRLHRFSTNAYVNELSGNGLYELFAAYLNNELDYDQFYKRVEKNTALDRMRQLLQTNESHYTSNEGIVRKIVNAGPEKKMNVVLISVESLSADFLGSFGNHQGITPHLDSLAEQSLLFTNLYATGTRTVRGLEALSLCVPPTPGQSIVRRPENEGLASLGNVFEEKGYESKYIYGGYGYFDNMSYFFGSNGYEVIDRDALADEEISYENVWGVADENLFTLAEREIEKTVSKNKPVFAHIMTTSNHRPYTYPEGRIDIPSHSSREGAVKYTDYAIGRFIREAAGKPWFSNTLFIIVADHCASSAGKTELPINKYKIPMLVYSPGMITPGKMDRLMSQIDVGPTLLGLLNFSYTSKFFGYDMFKLEPGRERAFISTYQTLGFIRNDSLVVLSPQQKFAGFRIGVDQTSVEKANVSGSLVEEAVTWYQWASYSFKNGLMKSDAFQQVNR